MNKGAVIVTGAGIGIGRATAVAFARAGYHAVVTDVLAAEGEDSVRTIRGTGGSAEFLALDVTDTTACNAMVASIESRHGPVGTLVLNAGIAHKIPLATMSDAEWDHTIDVDLKGMMRVLRAAAPGMRAAKRGNVVCVASVVGTRYGWAEHIPYSAAKAGVAGFVRGAAAELAADGIRVNGIAPGFIRTAQTLDAHHSVGEEGLAAVAPKIPLRRVGTPEDIADVAVFLASDAARYLTGQVLTVDGGLAVSL